MPKGCLVPLGFVGGLIAGYAACFFAYLFFTAVLGWHDREGAWAMGVAFTIGPFFGVLCGVGIALWLGLRKPRA